jgi:hypothetical protein
MHTHRPPYIATVQHRAVGAAPSTSVAPTLTYKGTVAWRAVPLVVQAKARATLGVLDLQIRGVVDAGFGASLTKVQIMVDVPQTVLRVCCGPQDDSTATAAVVSKAAFKPEGGEWRAGTSCAAWQLPVLAPGTALNLPLSHANLHVPWLACLRDWSALLCGITLSGP